MVSSGTAAGPGARGAPKMEPQAARRVLLSSRGLGLRHGGPGPSAARAHAGRTDAVPVNLRPGKLTAAHRLSAARREGPGAEPEAAGRGNALAESAARRGPRRTRGPTGGRCPLLRTRRCGSRPGRLSGPWVPPPPAPGWPRRIGRPPPALQAPAAAAQPLLSFSPALSQFHFFEKQTGAFPFPFPKRFF